MRPQHPGPHPHRYLKKGGEGVKGQGGQGKVKGQAVKKTAKQPWPKSLADRIRAVEAALHAAGAPVTAADLTQHFSKTKAPDLHEILESLAALGRARMDGERFSV